MKHSLLRNLCIALGLSSLCGILLAGLFYYQKNQVENRAIIASKQAEDRETVLLKEIHTLNQRYTETLNQLELSQEERADLAKDLMGEQERLEEIEDEYNRINNAVSDLVKLQNTDEELLQKYSRVYFLNENYIPQNLTAIPSEYTWGNTTLYVHTKVWPFLEKLLERAERDDIDLLILSAYRSFETQEQLKQRYLTVYGKGSNQFSADQGYSEHQLGSTIDFTTPAGKADLSLFKQSDAYEWLQKKAHRYGFTLSYPEGNSFYQFEPWHWRFVGKDLSDDLYDDSKYFYDIEQRKIDEYLLKIFD